MALKVVKNAFCPAPGEIMQVGGRQECVSPHQVEESVIVRPDPNEADWGPLLWIGGTFLLLSLLSRGK